MIAIFLSVAAFFSTLVGGIVAIKNRQRLHYLLGFTAGVLLGVVAFDVLPEIFSIIQQTGIDPIIPMIALVVGFLAFHIAEKLTILHSAHETEYAGQHRHPRVGVLSALALSGHSFADGLGIGLAFQASPAIGVAVAIAVIAHDFSDGLNTAGLALFHHNTPRRAVYLLLLDAIAPILGAASTLFFHPSERFLVIYLGFFAGFLLYIGASDILPQAHSEKSSRLTIALTILGTLFMYLVTRVAL